MKENVWRAKRLTREMLTYWKRYDRNERETRKKQEKEAEEQRKMDVELMEVSKIIIVLFNFYFQCIIEFLIKVYLVLKYRPNVNKEN